MGDEPTDDPAAASRGPISVTPSAASVGEGRSPLAPSCSPIDHGGVIASLDEGAVEVWHALPPDAVLDALGTDAEKGLTSAEAANRLATHGPNVVGDEQRWIRLRRFVDQFQDVLIWLLLVAAAVSGLLLGAWIDASAIAAIVLLDAVLGYVQESRAEAALGRLAAMAAPDAVVVRDGVTVSIPTADVVPGDILVLSAGDQIAADARVFDAIRLSLSEGMLTGESVPVTKAPHPVVPEAGLGDRSSMVHSGTTVASGRGTAVVTATGPRTEMGQIASLIGGEDPPTPLQIELGRVGRRLALVAIVAAFFVFGAGLARSYPVETMFLTAVAMAVAAIPEGLPAVVTVSLAGGVQRMAARGAIVRRLPAVEALGAVDVICTDKTGTLTLNDLRVTRVVVGREERALAELAGRAAGAQRLIQIAVLCNDARTSAAGFEGDPTEVALLMMARQAGVDIEQLRRKAPRLDEAAFDSRRKRMSVLVSAEDEYLVAVKGAPEVLLGRSTGVLVDDRIEALGDRDEILETAERLAADGLRTLAFGFRTTALLPEDVADAEHDLVFVGMVGFSDAIRPEVPEAVRGAARAGVRTVMVTGDHAVTAQAIATEAGLGGGPMLGSVLREMTVEELTDVVDDFGIYARVDPVDKVKIVEAWRASGATVAMTGDGVNDAPALHRSDIGVAMGSGTDVARASSSLVLADDNYATIVAAIRDGRRIFGNLRNVVHYLLSANAAELLYVAVGFLVFGALGEPLLAVQLLWINLLSDALPAIALGMDTSGHDVMRDAPGTGRNVLSGRNLFLLLTQGALLAGAAFGTLVAGHVLMSASYPTTRTMVFCTLVVAQLLHALNVRSADDGRLRAPRPLLVAAILGSLLLQVAVVYLPFGHIVFDTEPLGAAAWGWITLASATSFVVIRALNLAMMRQRAIRP